MGDLLSRANEKRQHSEGSGRADTERVLALLNEALGDDMRVKVNSDSYSFEADVVDQNETSYFVANPAGVVTEVTKQEAEVADGDA